MRTILKTIYQYDELSDRAKEKAREWYASCVFNDSCDWGCIYEDAATVAEILGIDLRQERVTLMNGQHRYDPAIYFSGFSSQGDGACFEGTYSYAKGTAKKIRGYAPQDEELHRIADELQAVQRRHFYRLIARISQGRSYWVHVEVQDRENPYADIGDAEGEIRDLMRDFANWIYKQLEAEYEYLTSDEAVEESIRANEYEFDEDGERV